MFEHIIEKFGSACHFDEYGEPNYDVMAERVREIERDMVNGRGTTIVASGAVPFGMRKKGDTRSTSELTPDEKINYASIGQSSLMDFYERISGRDVSQILLSAYDLKYSEEMYDTINTLQEAGNLVVVNRNDPTDLGALKRAYQKGLEMSEVDNDITAAWMVGFLDADLLFKRSLYDGFMDNGSLIEEIPQVNSEYRELCGEGTKYGSGGGESMLNAADYILQMGKFMATANINYSRDRILENEVKATWIPYYPLKETYHLLQ